MFNLQTFYLDVLTAKVDPNEQPESGPLNGLIFSIYLFLFFFLGKLDQNLVLTFPYEDFRPSQRNPGTAL